MAQYNYWWEYVIYYDESHHKISTEAVVMLPSFRGFISIHWNIYNNQPQRIEDICYWEGGSMFGVITGWNRRARVGLFAVDLEG